MPACPLCLSANEEQIAALWVCGICELAYKDPTVHLTAIDEKARYATHNNCIDDEGYVSFLRPVVMEIVQRKATGARGMDYGSGPGPVLQKLLQQKGFKVEAYDPFFSPIDLRTVDPFDFITCTESAEHFFVPARDFAQMFSLLVADGTLALMTLLYTDKNSLNNWWYAKDPTHVCFYSDQTIAWIAQKFSARVEILSPRLAVFSLAQRELASA